MKGTLSEQEHEWAQKGFKIFPRYDPAIGEFSQSMKIDAKNKNQLKIKDQLMTM